MVVFIVTEQRQISSITFRGNTAIDNDRLRAVINVNEGEAIDRFRLALARQGIENLYRDKNFPFAHVEVVPEPLAERGEIVFLVVEGPNVRVRNSLSNPHTAKAPVTPLATMPQKNGAPRPGASPPSPMTCSPL